MDGNTHIDQQGQSVYGDQTNIAGDQIITHIYEAQPFPLLPAEAKDRRELGILLKKVKQFWIEGVLERSLHTIALLDVSKETQPGAVTHAWEQVLELPNQTRQILPADQKISQIFDEMHHALLILGEPGSGKTIALLQLTRDLISQMEQDGTFSQPVPVIFNLSTWQTGQSLINWLVEELSAKYQIPKRIGRPWLENNRLLPLLDGLDEVRNDDQASCVGAINQFGQEYGLSGLVVCSRLEEYTRLPVRLKLNGAICLQPLTPAQVSAYLDQMGDKLDALKVILQTDKELQELAQSPLSLGIMSLAYQDVTTETLTAQSLNTVETRRQHLLDTYIKRMFSRKGQGVKPYDDQQTKAGLAWLAKGMKHHALSIFLIEQLQPTWLFRRRWIWGYALLSRSMIMLLTWPLFGLTMSFWVEIFGLTETLLGRPGGWLIFGLVAGLTLGPLTGMIYAIQFQSNDESVLYKENTFLSLLVKSMIIGLIFGVGSALISALFTTLQFGVMMGVGAGIFYSVFYILRAQYQLIFNDIQTVEALSWSWENIFRNAILGLSGGFIFGGIIGLLSQQDQAMVSRAQEQGLNFFKLFGTEGFVLGSAVFWALMFGIGIITFGGLNSKVVEAKTVPNQGIRLSLRNTLLIGFGFGIVMGLIINLVIAGGIGSGLLFGIIAASLYGGIDVIQHYTLRLMLWLQGTTPRHYIHFLDYAADRIFLQKVGGGYIFVHRLLLEHFATLDLDE